MSLPTPSDATGATFHAPGPRVEWFSGQICQSIPDTQAPLRVLDIGCGTGDQIFDLAARLPRAWLVGVDISSANVAIAEQRRRSHHSSERLAFETADYVAYRATEPFDLIVSYSVLQFMAADTHTVASRIAEDLRHGGFFVNAMPYSCAYNQALGLVRRALRASRSTLTDRLLMRAARALHGASLDEVLLAERIGYAYAVPDRFDDELAASLEAAGLTTIERKPVAHASPAQMKHSLRIMQRP